MADLVVFQLLRRRTLLVDVVTLALAKRPIHLAGGDVQRLDRGVVEATLVAGELEHGERLAAVIDQHPLAAQLVPGERGVGRPAGEEEAVLLVDLREVRSRRVWPFSSDPKPCEGADWQTCTLPSCSPAIAEVPAGAMECLPRRPSCSRKPAAIVAISGE